MVQQTLAHLTGLVDKKKKTHPSDPESRDQYGSVFVFNRFYRCTSRIRVETTSRLVFLSTGPHWKFSKLIDNVLPTSYIYTSYEYVQIFMNMSVVANFHQDWQSQNGIYVPELYWAWMLVKIWAGKKKVFYSEMLLECVEDSRRKILWMKMK